MGFIGAVLMLNQWHGSGHRKVNEQPINPCNARLYPVSSLAEHKSLYPYVAINAHKFNRVHQRGNNISIARNVKVSVA